MKSDISLSEFALLAEEELDDMADTFDSLAIPETPVATDTVDDDIVEDDSVLADVGAEIADDAIEQIASEEPSDDDGLLSDTAVVDDETGSDITDDLAAAAAGADDDVAETPTLPGEDDSILDDDDDDSDDLGDVTPDEAEISPEEMSDLDADDLLDGGFDSDDKLVLDDAVTSLGDVEDDVDDLVESTLFSES